LQGVIKYPSTDVDWGDFYRPIVAKFEIPIGSRLVSVTLYEGNTIMEKQPCMCLSLLHAVGEVQTRQVELTFANNGQKVTKNLEYIGSYRENMRSQDKLHVFAKPGTIKRA
jgi:hypothetical protein